jgi:hypothetical protein
MAEKSTSSASDLQKKQLERTQLRACDCTNAWLGRLADMELHVTTTTGY